MIRAFIAVQISPDVGEKIAAAQSELKRSLKGIRWVNPDNFHFTLKFLGAVKEEDVPSISSRLEYASHSFSGFPIAARGIGVFPDIRRPRVLWVGLAAEKLRPLAMDLERELEPLGFDPERRDFKPHLTLGRWRDSGALSEPLRKEIERWKDYDFGESWIKEIVLFQSVLKPDGALYSPLRVVSLSRSD